MNTEKIAVKDLWVPREVDALWTMGDGIMRKTWGSYQTCLLDNLRAMIDTAEGPVALATKYRTYNEYVKDLEHVNDPMFKSPMYSKGDLKEGKQLLAKGITSEKLKAAKEILEKLLEK